MKFFELTRPDYLTDYEDEKANPVETVWGVSLPALVCDKCAEQTGGQWAGSDRIRVSSQKEQQVNRFLIQSNVSNVLGIEEWLELRKEIAEILEMEKEKITPGAQIGPPKGRIISNKLKDLVHPFPGQIWVKTNVMKVFKENNISGLDFVEVELINEDKNKRLWEIDVTGKAWREGMSKEKVIDCGKCNRFLFPNPGYLTVDKDRWDGTDVFNVDLNPNIVLVSEKVRKVLEENNITNYQCIPV